MEITRIRPSARDARTGSPSTTTTSTTLTVTAVGPSESEGRSIDQYGRDGAREVLTVYCADPDIDVAPTDQLVIDGATYKVEGWPRRYRSPYAGLHGATIEVWRAVG